MVVACEVECAYCKQIVSLGEDAIGRAVPCPECGGMIALVAPVPTVSVAPPEPPDFPALSEGGREPGCPYVKPNVRAHLLCGLWPSALRGLNTARWAVLVALWLYLFLLAADLLVFSIVFGNFFPWERNFVRAVAALQLIPLALHTAGQRACADGTAVPGAYLARRSAALVWCAVIVLLVLSFDGRLPFAALLLVASGLWLAFLARLGRRLEDRAFVAEVRVFAWLYGTGIAVVLALAVGAHLARLANNIEVGWMCRAAAGFIGLLLICGYDQLLAAAARSIARCAPVTTSRTQPPPEATRVKRPILPA